MERNEEEGEEGRNEGSCRKLREEVNVEGKVEWGKKKGF